MNKFESAKQAIAEIISRSKTEEDPVHSINAWQWLLKLKPDASEILQLAILAHDIKRSLPKDLTPKQNQNDNSIPTLIHTISYKFYSFWCNGS